MTANEILTKAFGLAGENFADFPDKNLGLIWLNISIAECLDAENIIRNRDGENKMETYSVVKQLSEEVNLSEQLCNMALPYAVASYLFNDRQDNYMSAIFRNRFVSALQTAAKPEEKPITDVYGGRL